MESKEGRIIMLGMVAGAAAGGIAVLLMRVRAGQPASSAVRMIASGLNWSEVLGLGVAAIGMARRISALSESMGDGSAASD